MGAGGTFSALCTAVSYLFNGIYDLLITSATTKHGGNGLFDFNAVWMRIPPQQGFSSEHHGRHAISALGGSVP